MNRRTGRCGLDDRSETERPWSSTAHRDTAQGDDLLPSPSAGALRVVVRYTIVDGEDGKALGERQAAAIRAVVEWAFAHSTTGEDTHRA